MKLEIGASCVESVGSETQPSTVGAGGVSTVMRVCGAGVEPTRQTRQVAASVALLCVCQIPVAVAAIRTARNAAQNSSNVARGLVGPRFIMGVTTSPPIFRIDYTCKTSPSWATIS